MTTIKRELMCALTEAEWKERATDHARFSKRHDQLQEEGKAAAQDLKERLSGCKGYKP